MGRIVTGVFESRDMAESAAYKVKDRGLRTEDISIVAKGGEGNSSSGDGYNENSFSGDNVSDGLVEGGILGGVAGLLLGMGTIAIPGLGIIAAAGPIAGLLSGAITGGIVGTLIDLGIPEKTSREFEIELKRGNVVWSMRTPEENVEDVEKILEESGAVRVASY